MKKEIKKSGYFINGRQVSVDEFNGRNPDTGQIWWPEDGVHELLCNDKCGCRIHYKDGRRLGWEQYWSGNEVSLSWCIYYGENGVALNLRGLLRDETSDSVKKLTGTKISKTDFETFQKLEQDSDESVEQIKALRRKITALRRKQKQIMEKIARTV